MRIYLRSLASPRGSNPCYRRERAISPRQEPSFSPSLVEPSWAALRSGSLSAAASRVQSAAFSASFFLVPNDTQRRCRPRYKLTGRRRQLRTHKAVPAGAAPRMWSTDSTSRPSSHCPGESSPLATPPTRTINTRHASRAEKTQRTYHAAGVRFTAWCAIHGQTALQASRRQSSPSRRRGPRNLAVNTLYLRHTTCTFAGIKRARRRRSRRRRLGARSSALRSADHPQHARRITRPASLPVGFAAALPPSEIVGLQTCQIVRHSDGAELYPPLAQERLGRARHKGLAAGRPYRSLPGSRRSTPGSRPRRSPRARSSGASGVRLRRASEERQGEASTSSLLGWLRRFDRTDRPAMD
jgi:hypothetical protein